ncbi:T9SS type A sorting domain-containing protein [Catalinimonas niigatensis]|uniref:T9SS type A sorting domain-containing protein n=1 Tax=Catalinimonas niigatensis TaxID=1397264 RepID=UPI0026664DB4|nr:T9SS type A sorting domain-containing protein [Catalinimonas niigatensis]WPP48067.1 T9SS type A sorting domain-containing protein [Catalinimonas niigatensis]
MVEFEGAIPVIQDNERLDLSWAGGLNSGQYYNIDLNLDGQQDIIIFDRTSDQFIPLLSQNQKFVHAPEYSLHFPQGISSWVVFADYDGDGKQDLFTASGKRSITVYRNVSEKHLAWERVADPLGTLGFSGFEIAIQINPSDVPAISDIDDDGDLDIVVYNVNGRGNLEYYQNMSQEQYKNSNSLVFEAKENEWGGIKECDCGVFAFAGENCVEINSRKEPANTKQQHIGGKALLAIDVDGDGDKDILSSDEGCGLLYFFENIGTKENALFKALSTDYPESFPENVSMSFPAAYHVDVTQDGIKDLIIAPNITGETVGSEDMTASSWLYKNTGTDEIPVFALQRRDFLQSDMIDVGENASPVLADYDADGDLDLFIAHRGSIREDEYYAGIYLYENTGSTIDPFYTFITSDYLGLSQLKLQQVKIYFEDINKDGLKDLLLSGAENVFSSRAKFYALENSAANGQADWRFNPEQRQSLNLEFHPSESLTFYDIDEDGDKDVFIAKREGNLEYYQNSGGEQQIDWQLMSENAGGISGSIFNRDLSVLLYDFEGDSKPDLLRSDASGVMILYPDFLSQLEEEVIGDTVVAMHEGQEKAVEIGKRISLEATKLDNSGKTYLFLGSPQGGIRLMSYHPEKGRTASLLLLYPNPTFIDKPQVKVRAPSDISSLQLISMTGAVLMEITPEGSKNELTIDTTGLSAGIYLIRTWDSDGKVGAGKLIVR